VLLPYERERSGGTVRGCEDVERHMRSSLLVERKVLSHHLQRVLP
jgi:hypothetical protein